MPGIDGHTTAKLISMDRKFENTPIIVFSSLKSPEMMELSKKVGAVIHLNKDAGKEKILYTVDEALKISDPGRRQI
ncbi:MAG: Response regulator receiver domain protein [bacterium ADurb.Bin270]|nr:MAG: Response regulator receiver domain protein [bacterium ADurb.Bin270]